MGCFFDYVMLRTQTKKLSSLVGRDLISSTLMVYHCCFKFVTWDILLSLCVSVTWSVDLFNFFAQC